MYFILVTNIILNVPAAGKADAAGVNADDGLSSECFIMPLEQGPTISMSYILPYVYSEWYFTHACVLLYTITESSFLQETSTIWKTLDS
jgi:hypothetical protein